MNVAVGAVTSGVSVVAVGTVVSWVVSLFSAKIKDCSCSRDWNKYHIMEFALFFTGAFTHMLFVALGAGESRSAYQPPVW